MEQFTKQEREAIIAVEDAAREPLRLPSLEEVEAQVRQLGARRQQDPESAREQLRRWLRDGSIWIWPRPEDGAIVAEGALLPLAVIDDGTRKPKKHQPETTSMISGRWTGVAGRDMLVYLPGFLGLFLRS